MPKDGKRFGFLHQYDFGDNWQHEVLFEGCLRAGSGQRYPLCIEGERACPPEDVGGVWGYAEYLEAMADPKSTVLLWFLFWCMFAAARRQPEDYELAIKHVERGIDVSKLVPLPGRGYG